MPNEKFNANEIYAQISQSEKFATDYPMLHSYATLIKPMTRPLLGREKELHQLRTGLLRPELCNVLLLGDAGAGKTALVQGSMAADAGRIYVEIDLSKMIADLRDANEMATRLKALFENAQKIVVDSGIEIVLFMDEFHLVTMLSPAAVEALKPMLADSGTRGIRVIAATTFSEFTDYISANQPLVQRLQRINIMPPEKDAIVSILGSFAHQYKVAEYIRGTHLFEQIIELSNKYIPANSQPRKSILLFDQMVGWFRAAIQDGNKDVKFDVKLLHTVLSNSEGIQLNIDVDAVSIKKRLDSKVYAQYLATSSVASRLQICAADLHNKSKPMSSFLFTGSTGVGKGCVNSTKIPIFTQDKSAHYKHNGDLKVGDMVFNREGKPVKVVGVFPQGLKDIYEVSFTDGRALKVDGSHLWGVYPSKRKRDEGLTVYSTETLIKKSLVTYQKDNRVSCKYYIPMNEAVEWPEREYSIHPYVLGALIGNGCMTDKSLTLSSNDEFTVDKVAKLIGCGYNKTHSKNYNWQFTLNNNSQGQTYGSRRKYIQVWELGTSVESIRNVKLGIRRIPLEHMTGSIEQRWQLIQGLFDTDGSIGKHDGDRFNVSYSTVSEGLAQDIQELLYSVGVSSTIEKSVRSRITKNESCELIEYTVRIKSHNSDKYKFFSLPRKLDIARKSVEVNKQREKTFDYVGIKSITKLDEQDHTTCIMVDDPEHLYQAGQFIVTHNTELTKQLSEIMFNDPKRLIRFDMTEFALENSLERFRAELTARVWERPYSVLLFDEIEKANGVITRLLLQVLDDGRLIDRNNREVSFLNTYIVLTTNAASEIYEVVSEYANSATATDEEQINTLRKYMKVIRRAIVESTGSNRFPPELLGRIDAICPFMPLAGDTQRKIIIRRMEDFKLEVKRLHGIDIRYATDDILTYLLYDKLDVNSNSGGARIVATKFEEEIVTAVASFINRSDGQFGRLVVKVEGEMAIQNKNLLEGSAYISVCPVANNVGV